jgi:hypothetical protein
LRQVPQSDFTQMAQKMETYVLNQLKQRIRHILQEKYGEDVDAWKRSLTRLLNNPGAFKDIEVAALREVWRELNGEEAEK